MQSFVQAHGMPAPELVGGKQMGSGVEGEGNWEKRRQMKLWSVCKISKKEVIQIKI